MTPSCKTLLAVVFLLAAMAGDAAAADRYVLVVTGASGTPEYKAIHTKHREALLKALAGPLALPAANLIVLKDAETSAQDSATREHVMAAIKNLASRVKDDDSCLIVLFGHGTDDGVDAKFNLVGPDMTAEEWRTALQPMKGRVVFIDTTAASASFLAKIAGPGRIVITATDSPAQQFDTVFAEFLGPAFTGADADLDKDGRVSIGEAFAFASANVKRYYAERGQLSTEHAVLDDNGDGRGKEAGTAGPDGALASRTFLDPGPEVAASHDAALSDLLARRAALEGSLEELKRKKSFMPAADYTSELERVLLDLARLSRQIRDRS